MSEVIDEGILVGADQGEKIIVGIGVADVGASMQRFAWADYLVFVCMLLVCIVVGLYFGFIKTTESIQDYLVGGRSMKTFPVAMSLVASFISGISLLGIPTEIYVYGIQYVFVFGGVLCMAFIFGSVYLPVFRDLNITSTYEYLERRFDRKIRIFGSVLYSISLITWLPVVIYVPALAFNQVTGINVHLITPLVCLICIFYTTVGGLKAVVWTDVIQTGFMMGAIALVAIKGTMDVGGIGVVWQRNLDSDRIEGPNFDLNPLSRHTVWALVVGGTVYWLQAGAVNQSMIQRYLSLPTTYSAKLALWLFVLGIFIILCLCSYCGMLIYATYHKCDPLTTTLAKEKDQLLPLLVMEVLGNFPGIPGLFVAGVFSAALSSLSTGLNSMAAIVLEDFCNTFFGGRLTNRQANILMKTTVIVFGAICVGLVFVVEKLGTVLQLTMSIGAIAAGPSFALFTMGMLLPWITAKGALFGGISGLVFMSWLCIKAQAAIVSGDLHFPEKPVATEGCHYHFTPKQSKPIHFRLDSSVNMTDITHTDETFMIYRLSYLWYTLIGALFTTVIALIVSYVTKPLNPKDVDPSLLAPFVRRLIPPRYFPNQPNPDEIIYAYETTRTKISNPDREVVLKKLRGPESA